jgi:hypothetical protein
MMRVWTAARCWVSVQVDDLRVKRAILELMLCARMCWFCGVLVRYSADRATQSS